MILVNQQVPDIIDAERMPAHEAARYVIVDPESRRELAFVKAADTVRATVVLYRTVGCMPDDPQCIRYDGKPMWRKFATPVIDNEHILRVPTYERSRDFDVVERGTGVILKQVRRKR